MARKAAYPIDILIGNLRSTTPNSFERPSHLGSQGTLIYLAGTAVLSYELVILRGLANHKHHGLGLLVACSLEVNILAVATIWI